MDTPAPAPQLVVPADLHCHILPAWDDGASDLEESLAMAQRWAQAGIACVAATPHIGNPGVYARQQREEPASCTIPDAVARLQEQVDAAGIPLRLLSGGELTFHEIELARRVGDCPWLTYGQRGKYLLIESTFGGWPRFADQLVSQLVAVGVTPIIAHPERLPDVQREPRLLETAVQDGALLQLTARNLITPDSRRCGRCARELVELGLAGLIASDAHRAGGIILPGDTAAEIIELVGEGEAQQLLCENPRRILAGEAALPPPPREKALTRQSRIFAFFHRT